MTTHRTSQLSVLAASTVSFTVCFAVWMMFAVIGIPIKQKVAKGRAANLRGSE